MKLQLALNVRNIGEAISYYSKLFNTPPYKQKEYFAKFEIQNPPLKLVLIEDPYANDRINHLGVELNNDEDLSAIGDRLSYLGISEKDDEFNYAAQNKVSSKEPQGLHWQWYTKNTKAKKTVNHSQNKSHTEINTHMSESIR